MKRVRSQPVEMRLGALIRCKGLHGGSIGREVCSDTMQAISKEEVRGPEIEQVILFQSLTLKRQGEWV